MISIIWVDFGRVRSQPYGTSQTTDLFRCDLTLLQEVLEWCQITNRLRWSRGSVLVFSTQVRGFKPGRSRWIFKGEKILSMPSFGGEVKPSVPWCRFAACKRSLNGVEVIHFGKITGQHSRPQFHLPPLGSLASWRTWRHLVVKVGTSNREGSNGKLPLRTCPGCSVPEPYQSPDWALVSAQTGPRAEYL